MTVQELADELGLHVMRTLELCRTAGAQARSGGDHLAEAEVERVRALAGGAAAGAPPPPTWGAAPPSPPPPSPPAWGAAPPPSPPAWGGPPPQSPPQWPGGPQSRPPPAYGPRAEAPKATAALVVGILAMVVPVPFVLGVVGLVLASQASSAIAASGRRLGGDGKVTAGRVLSIISLSIWGMVVVLLAIGLAVGDDDEETRGSDDPISVPEVDRGGDAVEGEDTPVFDLQVGECFNLPADEQEVRSLGQVSCDRPHDVEIAGNVELTDDLGAPYPGEEAIDELAIEECIDVFEMFVGADYAESELDAYWLQPSEFSWETLDDREITCAVVTVDGSPLIGTVEGSGR